MSYPKQNEEANSLTYRLAVKADVKAIVDLVNVAYRPAPHLQGWAHESNLVTGDRTSPQQVEKLLTTESWVLLVLLNGEIAGCAHGKRLGTTCQIGMFATHPRVQNQGIGHQLLNHAEQFAAKSCNTTSIEISVLTGRPELLAFYERRGYFSEGQPEPYPSGQGFGVAINTELGVLRLNKSIR